MWLATLSKMFTRGVPKVCWSDKSLLTFQLMFILNVLLAWGIYVQMYKRQANLANRLCAPNTDHYTIQSRNVSLGR